MTQVDYRAEFTRKSVFNQTQTSPV